jgi:alkane 1-monooxygenase
MPGYPTHLAPSGTVPDGTTELWKDRKRYLWLIGLVVPSLAFIAFGGYVATGWSVFFWVGPIVILGIVPAIDLVAGLDRSNPPDDVIEALEQDRYYRWITYLFLPIQYVGFLGAMAVVGGWDVFGVLADTPLTTIDKVGLAISIGCIGGIGINTAHELGHKKEANERWLSKIVLNAWVMSIVLWAVVLAAFGLEVAPYLVIQAVVGFSLLEVVNYMEHYGMLRQKVGEGDRQRYERVLPGHSWNSNNIATNVLLYHLQRHSDHHANPTRRYQSLRDFEESPVLPTGYAGMIVLAIVPAVWRRVMDQRVVDHFGGDVSLANISPRKREAYLERYDAAGHAARVEAARIAAEVLPGAVDEVLAARCPGCEYVYEVAAGDEHEGFAAGTAWADIPADWCCPDCGVREKVDFVPFEPERSVA